MKQEPDFIVCGEALFDVFVTGSTPSGMSLDARVGGSPFNVAVGLARLAQSVAFFGSLSRDPFGDFLAEALASEGVDTSTVVRTDAPTTLSMVSLDALGVPSYEFDGERRADRQLMLEALEYVPGGRARYTWAPMPPWWSRSPAHCERWWSGCEAGRWWRTILTCASAWCRTQRRGGAPSSGCCREPTCSR